jgi:hypothetical protein
MDTRELGGAAPASTSGAADMREVGGARRTSAISDSRGGIGRVLHALDQVLDRPVALKELFSDSPARYERMHAQAA